MQLIRHLPHAADRPTAVAIGNFDGLHLGHRAVIDAMLHAAAAASLRPTVLTFEPHPRRFFKPELPAFRIERLAVKLARLRDAGVARVAMPRFDATLAGMTAEAFLGTVLQRQLGAQAIITGENFAFGRDRGGDAALLRQWGQAHGITTIFVPPVRVGDVPCSSTSLRAALTAGDVVMARELLGRDYQLHGRVVRGDGLGRTIGVPTANIALPGNLLLPAYGVYAVRATVAGEVHAGVANLGVRPTINRESGPRLEVHLLAGRHELYGQRMTVDFVARLRAEAKFEGLSALKEQIARDSSAARALLAGV